MDTMGSPDEAEILSGDWFDVLEPGFRIDPYRYYRRLRQEDPIHWGTSYEPSIPGMWHIGRYGDITRILKDPRFVHQMPTEERAAWGHLCLALQ
jgi:cytochrome P450